MVPMRTAFDPVVRVLACAHCGAPLGDVASRGLQCGYCGARNRVSMPTRLPTTPPLAREEQLRRLAAQTGRRRTSPLVADFLDGKHLATWREQEAVAAWVRARGSVEHDEASATRFFELTKLLADAAHKSGDAMRERALLESGFDTSHLPRWRTYFAAVLAQRAAALGDPRSCRGWLERADPSTDDLPAFSALVIAQALLARLENNPGATLSAVGTLAAPAPLMADDEAVGAVLRADALERCGEVNAGADALESFVEARWPMSRAEVVLAREKLRSDACPRAFVQLDERRGRAFGRKNVYNIVVSSVFVCLWGGLGVFALYMTWTGSAAWVLGVIFGFGASAMLVRAVVGEALDLNAWRKAVWGTVQSLRPATPETFGQAEVLLDGSKEELISLEFEHRNVVEVGMRALVVKTWMRHRWLT